MTGRRPLLALLVVGLVAVVALVAHGRPLAASAGRSGLPDSFWSYAVTTTFILLALGVLFLLASLFQVRMTPTTPRTTPRVWFFRQVLFIASGAALAYFLHRYLHHGGVQVTPPGGIGNPKGPGNHAAASGPRFVWGEALIVLGLLGLTVVAAVWYRRRNRADQPGPAVAPEAVAEALDESLDDLRSDPDLRRAIVAAYARMENALRVTGLPRRPAEAPLEYLERALLTLDTSRPSVRRLTELFEWAKFSHHDPEAAMRDEAIDALMAVRDELRAPAEVAA
jgi:Domain of unknown function (DUF4129)